MQVKIHDIDTGIIYTANSEKDCKDKTDLSAYKTACQLRCVICMGKVVAEPIKQLFTFLLIVQQEKESTN